MTNSMGMVYSFHSLLFANGKLYYESLQILTSPCPACLIQLCLSQLLSIDKITRPFKTLNTGDFDDKSHTVIWLLSTL